MPELDDAFIAHVAFLIEDRLPGLKPVDQAELSRTFANFGRRAQFFLKALGDTLSPVSGIEARFEPVVSQACEQRQRDDDAQMESDYTGLRPLEQAVLWRLLEHSHRFRRCDSEALRFYQEKTGQKISAQKAQTALDNLR